MKAPRSQTVFAALDVIKFMLILVMLLMFIRFNAEVARQTQATQDIAASTNDVVKSQEDILAAIKGVTEDTRTTAAEQTAIIICMLQVRIAERTTDLQKQCRAEVEAVASNTAPGTTQNSTGINSQGSSSNPTPIGPTPQSNTSQPAPQPPVATAPPPDDRPGFIETLLSPVNNLLKRL